MRVATRLIAALVTLVLFSSCTIGGSQPTFQPSYREEPCPADLEPLLIPTHTCGYVTVLEDRSRPDGPTIKLFVVRVEPQGGTPPDRYPMYIPGNDIATSHQFFDLMAAAERVQRETIIVEQRGVGRSQPSLDCPEIDELSPSALEAGIDDPKERTAFLDAVATCRARLTTAGIDVNAYDLSAMVADAEDLRQALGVDSWGVMTYGTESLLSLEMIREDPSHIEQLVMDTPTFPQIDQRTIAVTGTRDALTEVFRACQSDARCARTYPHIDSVLSHETTVLNARPVSVRSETSTGDRVDVKVDGSTWLRVLRMILVDHGESPKAEEPATIYSAARGELAARALAVLSLGSPFCAGYLPECDEGHPVAEGTYLSVLCRDFAPWGDERATPDPELGDRVYVDAFFGDPWFEACARWRVPPADQAVVRPVTSDVPTLIFVGRYDPFAPLASVERAASSLSRHWIIVNPVGGHNALADTPCMIEIRNRWVDDPVAPPDRSCIGSMPPQRFDFVPV